MGKKYIRSGNNEIRDAPEEGRPVRLPDDCMAP